MSPWVSDTRAVLPTRSVLVVDDDVTPRSINEWFATDKTDRPNGERFALAYVCDTEELAHDELEQSADALPDLVLIDDHLPSGGQSGRRALTLMSWITHAFGDDRPSCILTTGSPSPTYCHAFCELGGHNVIDKHLPQDRLMIMWKTLDGARWMHAGDGSARFTLSDSAGELLPYLEHPRWAQAARDELGLVGVALRQRKSRLARLLGIPGEADRTEFVEAAIEQGILWVPLAYRHLLPAAHPEHRSTPFRAPI